MERQGEIGRDRGIQGETGAGRDMERHGYIAERERHEEKGRYIERKGQTGRDIGT